MSKPKPKRPSTKPPTRTRPSALVRAEHGGAPVRLDAAERQVFNEALRLGADLADEVEAKVAAYGRWLLESVFANDAAAALDERTKNKVWMELVRRSGGPTLRIGHRMLYIAVRLAAYDKRISDQTWRGLDAGRKELLLPLRQDRRLRDAAQHVTKFNLTQTKTKAYVGELLAKEGEAQAVRLTAPLLIGRMKKIHETLGSASTLRKLRMSRGAYFVNQLACRSRTAFRAIATHSGGGPFGVADSELDASGNLRCPATLSALQVQGLSDTVVPPSEGIKARDFWRAENACGATSSAYGRSPCVAYDGCARPEVWCAIPGLGHALWSSASRVTWDFFASMP